MARIQQIKHPDGDVIYPISHTNAIVDDDGNRLKDVLYTLESKQSKFDTLVVNDLNTSSAERALSAEMGKQLNETKAPKVGYAPDLKVNFAKELVGRGEATPEVIGSIRPTGVRSIGDGNATIERIKGESVVWNQCIQGITNYTDALAGLSFSMSEDRVISINGTATNSFMNPFVTSYGSAENALHKAPLGRYVLDVEIINNPDNLNLNIYALNNRISFSPTNTPTTSYKKIGDCSSLDVGGGFGLSHYGNVGTVFNDVQLKVSLYNLTLMFGSGKEPTTIEDFEARKPLGVSNEYNEGTIVSYDGDALKSVGFNAFTAENSEAGSIAPATGTHISHPTYHRSDFLPCVGNTEYEFINVNHMYEYDKEKKFIKHRFASDATTPPALLLTLDDKTQYVRVVYYPTNESSVCIHLSHSEYRNGEYKPYEADIHPLPNVASILDADGNQLFPNGLLSAGSVHDEITATKAIKRVGVVDMGTLDWTRPPYEDSFYYFRYMDATIAKGTSNTYANVLCKQYMSVQVGTGKLVDKSVTTFSTNNLLLIRDDAYTDIDSFKAANQGVLLYYELATPIEVDLPEELNMTYDAWDFGTEELVHDGATTPLNADIVYQFNAVDRIRENSSAIDALEGHVEEHKDDGIKLLDNGNLELTLKGVTKEFMPATPSGDPMHWAYVSAGAEYNATGADITRTTPLGESVTHKAGHYYLNYIGDITKEEMMAIYNAPHNTLTACAYSAFIAPKYRTFLFNGNGSSVPYKDNLDSLFATTNIEKIKFDAPSALYCYEANISKLFYDCKKLTHIIGLFYIAGCTLDRMFYHCYALQEFRIQRLDKNLSLSDSPLISKESLLSLINNSAATSVITITLHEDVYAKCVIDGEWYVDVNAALEAQPLITLASE